MKSEGVGASCVRRLIGALLMLLLVAETGAAGELQHRARRSSHHGANVQVGIDVLESSHFAELRGKHVGLITNHTGVDAAGRSTQEILMHAPGVQLVALFSPEHGMAGMREEKISSAKDSVTGLPVYSLYGETRRPTEEMLAGIDALVFDVQDAGVRFYTYTTTMAYCMEEAAKRKIAFYVLDRPNPIGGEIVEGPMLDADKTSFTAYFPIPVRYGLTIGELAKFFNEENQIHCELHVIAMKNWRRNYFYEETGLRWIPPSPALRTLKGSVLYPGVEILQNAGVSVGRGTETPFEEFGAPWMRGEDVAARLNERQLPGVRFVAQSYIPLEGLYAGQRCAGVGVRVTDKLAVHSMAMGMEIAALLWRLYPEKFDPAKMMFLVGNAETLRQLKENVEAPRIVESWAKGLQEFEVRRGKYLLYK